MKELTITQRAPWIRALYHKSLHPTGRELPLEKWLDDDIKITYGDLYLWIAEVEAKRELSGEEAVKGFERIRDMEPDDRGEIIIGARGGLTQEDVLRETEPDKELTDFVANIAHAIEFYDNLEHAAELTVAMDCLLDVIYPAVEEQFPDGKGGAEPNVTPQWIAAIVMANTLAFTEMPDAQLWERATFLTKAVVHIALAFRDKSSPNVDGEHSFRRGQ